MVVPSASPLFLREPEIRRGMELLYFGNSQYYASLEGALERLNLGRAHQRALYFIARQPDLPVIELLRLLNITKQSLGRVLNELTERGLVETSTGQRDRRQRLLRLTTEGITLEAELFNVLRDTMAAAYAEAGQGSVTGFWRVLEALIPPARRERVAELDSSNKFSGK